jgi:hypothetical protein
VDIGASAKVAASGAKMLPGIARWLMARRQRRQEATYARELLGVDQSTLFSYRVGMDHPLLQEGVPHTDDLVAFADLAGPSIARAWEKGWVEYPDELEANLNEGVVVIGSPESEALTRLIFGYQRLPDALGVEYTGNSVDLPFRWQEDTRTVSARCQRFAPGGRLVTRPNWPIVDNSGFRPKMLYPAVTNEGLLNSDFLLITRIPNFLTSEAQQSGRSIVSIAGTHGIGTRAVGLVLKNRSILTEISAKIPQGTQAFQVVIEARSIVHDPLQSSVARSVFVRAISCFDRPDNAWTSARQTIRERFTDWASEVNSSKRMGRYEVDTEGSIGRIL